MKNLHSIRSSMQRYIWGSLSGRNGHSLDNGRHHIWVVQRNTPPPLGTRERRYFQPWRHQMLHLRPIEKVTPLCGHLRTRSTNPNLNASYGSTPAQCRECQRLLRQMGIEGNFLHILQSEDPWNLLRDYVTPIEHRIDPVTGT